MVYMHSYKCDFIFHTFIHTIQPNFINSLWSKNNGCDHQAIKVGPMSFLMRYFLESHKLTDIILYMYLSHMVQYYVVLVTIDQHIVACECVKVAKETHTTFPSNTTISSKCVQHDLRPLWSSTLQCNLIIHCGSNYPTGLLKTWEHFEHICPILLAS